MGFGPTPSSSSHSRPYSIFFTAGLILLAYLWLRPRPCPHCPTAEVTCGTHLAAIERLKDENARLRTQLDSARQAAPSSTALTAASTAAAGSSPVTVIGKKTQMWYWTDIIMDALRPFEKLNGGITMRGLRLAEQKCKVSTWCHRAQVIGGRLYVTDLRAIFFDRHYAMARIMPLLLTMLRWPVPDFDALFSGTDYPIMEIPRDAAHMARMYGSGQPIPPLFSPTAGTHTLDLPWPDFSFFPPLGKCPMDPTGKTCTHPLKTPRWQKAHPELLAMGRKVRWEDKISRAVFTGNMKTSPNRQKIFQQGQHHPELLFVNEVYIKTSPPSCFDIGEPNVTNGGTLVKKCGLSFEEMCKYKYLLNVGSNGYANKLKYLFLCGSVVIWVRKDSLNHEFFERHFVPGIHYAPVDTVEEVPETIRRLQADDAFAKRVALAGQARMAEMDPEEVTHYCYRMLKAYAAMQRFVPKRDPRSWEVNCEDDLTRHYDRGGEIAWRYLREDNTSCLRPPTPGSADVAAPGWGGSYAGDKAPCLASHDLSAKEEVGVCTPGDPRWQQSGRKDGKDWDIPEAYKGGALPDWNEPDPAMTGKAAKVVAYNQAARP